MSITVTTRAARSQDMQACAKILNAWIDSTDWMPRAHSHEDVERHYKETVWADRTTLVAVDGTRVRGFATSDTDSFITALYVDQQSRGQGIGSLLLQKAMQKLGPLVQLYTFQANTAAQAFYKRHGFVEINRTTGDNEENLPDILLEWRA